MRKFAFYLPQFHEIEENNQWWGKGFTEWTNVKKAKPIFKKHIQPITLLDKNYYNLLNPDVQVWQSNLMKKYDIDGLIYYHYYFTGKKLLEKPAENMLKNEEIKNSFFFCWANHTWLKSWEGTLEVLIEQKYGNELDWEEHFQYLLQFFKDSRYEKLNNKPLFMIFKSDFNERKKLFSYFNQRCIEEGFNGICLIESYHGNMYNNEYVSFKQEKCDETKYIFLREPAVCLTNYLKEIRFSPSWCLIKFKEKLSKFNIINYVRKYDGNKLFKVMNKYVAENDEIIPGLFFQWDNTPRHSKRGYVITSPSKENFLDYYQKIKNHDYVFINAWNEWAEGMILKPTEQWGYKYLEWLKEANGYNDNNK